MGRLLARSLRDVGRRAARVRIVNTAPSAPLVSVIIPTFNWSSVLRLAIHSVLWQSMQDFEIVVVGDGCTDDSEAMVASIGDARVRWNNLPVNSGHQATPNNAGYAAARGKYIALLGHDDLWHPDHLRRLLATIAATGRDIVSSWTEMIGPPGTNFRVITGVYPRGRYQCREALVPSGLMLKREVPAKIGGWKDYRLISRSPDLDFVARARDAGYRFASTGALSVFKFNSALRKNSYILKPCHEQQEYIARMESERFFLLREALAVAKVHALRLPMRTPNFTPPPNDEARGWEVKQYHRFRGLVRDSNGDVS